MKSRLCVLFPGQGSQSVGMLNNLIAKSSVIQRLVRDADEIANFPLSKIISEGPLSKLTHTEYTQPAVVLAGYCHWINYKEFMKEDGSNLVMTGHSVGEYTALAAAGYCDFPTALKLAALRGRIMSEANDDGGMVVLSTRDPKTSIIESDVVERICGDILDVAAMNADSQIVLAGRRKDIDEAIKKLSEWPWLTADMLPVSGAFHSRYMVVAANKFANIAKKLLDQINPVNDHIVISNVTAQPHEQDDDLKVNLIKQIHQPVRWRDSLQTASSLGCTDYIPLGPGSVMKHLLRLNNRSIKTF